MKNQVSGPCLRQRLGALVLSGLLYCFCLPAFANCPDGGAGSPDEAAIAQAEKSFAELRQQKTFPWGRVQPYGEVIGNAVTLTPAFDTLNAGQKYQVLDSLPISAGFLVFSSDWRLLWYYYDFCTGAFTLLTEYDRHRLSYMGRGMPDIVRYPLTGHQQKITVSRFWSLIGYQKAGEYWISWVPGGGYFEVMVPAAQRAKLARFWQVTPRGYRYRVIDQVGNILAEHTLPLPPDGSKPLLRAGPPQAPAFKLGRLRQWSALLLQGRQQVVVAQIRQNRALARAVFAELLFDTAVSHTTSQPALVSNQAVLLQLLVRTLADPAVSAAYRHWQGYLQGHAVYTQASRGFDRCLFLYLQTVVYQQALGYFDHPDKVLAARGMVVSGAKAAEAYLQLAQSLDLDRATGTGLYHRALFDRMGWQPQAESRDWEAYLKWTQSSADVRAQVEALYQLGQSYLNQQNLVLADKYYYQALLKAESLQDQELADRYRQEFRQNVDSYLTKASLTEMALLLQDEAIRHNVLYYIAHRAGPSDRFLIPLLVPLLDDTRFQEDATMALDDILGPQDLALRPKLVALLAKPDYRRFYAIRALTSLQDKTALPLILPYLEQFPFAVIPAIGALGDASMVPLLEPYLSPSHDIVSDKARQAIETLRQKQSEAPGVPD